MCEYIWMKVKKNRRRLVVFYGILMETLKNQTNVGCLKNHDKSICNAIDRTKFLCAENKSLYL